MGNKIMELLEKNGQVSMVDDIFPLVFEEFPVEVSDIELLAQEYVEQLLCGCIAAGFEMVCVPVFKNNSPGELELVDMIYKRLR